jgi:hypothetical protein
MILLLAFAFLRTSLYYIDEEPDCQRPERLRIISSRERLPKEGGAPRKKGFLPEADLLVKQILVIFLDRHVAYNARAPYRLEPGDP